MSNIAGEGPSEVPVGGTLIRDYTICPRQVWLGVHAISPDEDDANLVVGRFLHAEAESHQSLRPVVGHSRFDAVVGREGELVVVEIKKSARALEAARMQLAFYLLELQRRGVHARGEIRVPDEHKRIPLTLSDDLIAQVEKIEQAVRTLAEEAVPPPARRVSWCSRCAYHDFCWS